MSVHFYLFLSLYSWFCQFHSFPIFSQIREMSTKTSFIVFFPPHFLSSSRYNGCCKRNTMFIFVLQEKLICQQMLFQASFCTSLKHFRSQIDWSWYQNHDTFSIIFSISLVKVFPNAATIQWKLGVISVIFSIKNVMLK